MGEMNAQAMDQALAIREELARFRLSQAENRPFVNLRKPFDGTDFKTWKFQKDGISGRWSDPMGY
jgi:hypothetical protein